jgi:ABC-type multidrug transport system ATPase subunit
MNLIAGVTNGGIMSGDIRFKNQPSLDGYVAFVECFDFHIEEFSVLQNLFFAARLRINEEMTYDECIQRCKDIAQVVGLDQVLDVTVGSGLRKGISGGQQKLLSIANELLALPSVLCLDEPTSGMYVSYNVALSY